MDKYKTQSNRRSIRCFNFLHPLRFWRLRGFHRQWLMLLALWRRKKGRFIDAFIGRRQGIATAAVAVSFGVLLFTTSVQAAQVTLAWDPNNPAPDGYRVYQRLGSGSYDYSSPVWPRAGDDATQTTCTIAGLADNTTYHYVVRAYVGSVESGNSNEATYQSAAPVVTAYTITATAGANGSISPGTVTVKSGDSQTFAIVPDSNYVVTDVKVDGVSVGAKTAYTFDAVNRNHTISASFASGSNTTPPPVPATHTITATAGAHGSISPGTVTVKSGDSQTFAIVPDSNYIVTDVKVDGASVGARTAYTFSAVDRDHTISASFALNSNASPPSDPNTITITATAGANGTISPSGRVAVDYGGRQIFRITADAGYEIENLSVDGVSQGIRNRYRFTNVTASHTISVSFVRTGNQAPVADAGPDQTVDEAGDVTLSGANSIDNDDGIVAYQWRQISGPSVQLNVTDDDVVTFVAPDVDEGGAALEFEITVTDASGASATDRCLVNVTWVNAVPTADAGSDQSVTAGESVSLTAEGSTDSDDGIATYEWTQLKGPAVQLKNSASPTPGFTAPDAGLQGASLVFQLTVTDAGGLQDTDNCTVTVLAENKAPQADAGPDQKVSPGCDVTLDGSKSVDPEGSDLTFHWRQTDGFPMALSDAMAEAPVFSVPDVPDNIPQSYLDSPSGNILVFELTVTDSAGLSSVDTCKVVVALPDSTNDDQPPVLTIQNPSNTKLYTRGRTIDISGTATDDQMVDRVIWDDNRGGSGVAEGTEKWRIQNLPLKRWRNVITITAYDSAGNSQSKTLTIYSY